MTAAVHHPAFAVDQCMRLANARDELLRECDQIRQVPSAVASIPGPYIFIRRINCFAPKDGDGHFSIEVYKKKLCYNPNFRYTGTTVR